MASPCANCVYKGTKYCSIFCGKWWLVGLLLVFVSNVWAGCTTASFTNTRSIMQLNSCTHGSPCDVIGDCGPYNVGNTWWTGGVVSSHYCNDVNTTECFVDYQCGSRNCQYSYTTCHYNVYCDTQEEADSVYCDLHPDDENCKPQCDSTKWSCNTETETTQTSVESTNIVCYGDNCFGTPYCEYITKSTTTCTNECGQISVGESEVPIRYEGRCNDDNLIDDDYCTQTKCTSFDGTYHLYKLCASREIVNGQQQFLPRFVGGGKGDCANAGYSETPPDSSTGSGGSSGDSIPNSCFMYGVGCPNKDTTNYNESDNRTPDKCFCEPLDAQKYISTIVCPDGSRTTFFGSCSEWQSAFSSSSTEIPPGSSDSGSENPPTSSGGEIGNWTTNEQGDTIIDILGVIAQRVGDKGNITNSVNLSLDDYSTTMDNSEYQGINRTDSVYNPQFVLDTAGLAHAIFHKLDSNNKILDTLHHVNGVCPCITFFSGNSQTFFTSGHITFKEIQFDLSNIKGYNLCSIISTIVVALASIVSFFIGFSIFKNASS